MQYGNWRKSSASGTSNCVEVASHGDSVLVRNTRNRDTLLAFTNAEWNDFLERANGGEFNLPMPSVVLIVGKSGYETDES